MMPRHAMAESVQSAEIEIYAAFINHFAKDIDPNKSLLIESTTALLYDGFGPDVASGIRTRIPEASATVVADLMRAGISLVPFSIPQHLVRQEIHYAMFSEEQRREIFNKGSLGKAWKKFYGAYPTATGIIRFSRVGFDAENKQAILYVEHACGGLCGTGFLVLFQLQWSRWEVIRNKNLWVS